MTELLNHQHCKNCERALPYGRTLCAGDCEEEYEQHQKKRSRMVLFFYGVMAVLLLVLIGQILGRF